jgi:Fe-S-cluster containining protein
MREAWQPLSARFGAYTLLLPGSPSFICQAELCSAHCCHAFSVSLGDSEVDRLKAHSGLPPSRFLECEDGVPITLPLAQPYLLARTDNCCALLESNLACGQYAGRPNACRLYPHSVIFATPAGQLVQPDRSSIRASLENLLRELTADSQQPIANSQSVPLLLAHNECPGFTGPPLTVDGWGSLLLQTARLQHSIESGST